MDRRSSSGGWPGRIVSGLSPQGTRCRLLSTGWFVLKVTVVIPTINRSSLLARTIDHIESQTVSRDHYEVVVIDNDSSDDTRAVLEQKAAVYPNLSSFFQPKPGAAATRNVGIRAARGDLILFIDDDIQADPALVESHLRYHREHPDVSIIGSVESRWADTSDSFLRYLRDRRIFNPYSIARGPMDFAYYHTGNVSTPRMMLEAAGGFDERFQVYGMEDIELGYRLEKRGCRMVFGPKARAIHHYFPTYDQFAERCEQAGFSLGHLLGLHTELRGRFIESGRTTRLLRPFHILYRGLLLLIRPLSRGLSGWEARRGSTRPVIRLLDFHYSWALRYHFFVGYHRYLKLARVSGQPKGGAGTPGVGWNGFRSMLWDRRSMPPAPHAKLRYEGS